MRAAAQPGKEGKEARQPAKEARKELQPMLVAPSRWLWRDAHVPGRNLTVTGLTHNYAIHRYNESHYTLVGGVYNNYGRGVFGLDGHTWRYGLSASQHHEGKLRLPDPHADWYDRPTQWRHLRRLFDGTHDGCYEAAALGRGLQFLTKDRAACVFDGRLSLVHFRGRCVPRQPTLCSNAPQPTPVRPHRAGTCCTLG